MDYINHVKQKPIQGIAGFGGGATGAAFRSAAGGGTYASLSELMDTSPSDGTYTFKLAGGTNTEFDAYVIARDGGWVKGVAYWDGENMNTSSAVNADGDWTTAEQGNYAGKLHSDDLNALMVTNKFLMRAHGGSDALFNGRAGMGKYEGGQDLPNWGTAQDPTSTYGLDLDYGVTGTFDYESTYGNDTRALCNSCCSHVSSIWVSDHNFNFSGTSAGPICWTVGADRVNTNLHWMGGSAGSSGGTVNWGGSGSGRGFQIFFK